jgi:hypothetical protein
MPRLTTTILANALFLIAVSALSAGASAQNVYKCGNVYSQTPCPGGVAVDASDSRSSADKTQRDATTVRTAQTADRMEKERLAQEKKDLVANTPSMSPTAVRPSAAASSPVKPETAKKPKLIRPKKVDGFVAQVPGTQKIHKSKTQKKNAKKQPESPPAA